MAQEAYSMVSEGSSLRVPIAELIKVSDEKQNILTNSENYVCSPSDLSIFDIDIKDIDWCQYLRYFCYLIDSLKGCQNDLEKQRIEIDQKICDLLHLIELYDLDDNGALEAYDSIKEARIQRREIKDRLQHMEYFQKSIGVTSNLAKANEAVRNIEKMDKRKYFPRQLPEIFQKNNYPKTNRMNFLLLKNTSNEPMITEEEYMDFMQLDYQKTIFDEQQNDWLGFIKQQQDFFGNARQYMINLEIELREIEDDLEDALAKTEDAVYNAAQGYKVFREIKDLRSKRKEIIRELRCLEIITEKYDWNYMKEATESSYKEIQELF